MKIRYTKNEDIEKIRDIYSEARNFMAKNGNPHQWGDTNWPPISLILEDIENKRSYVIEEDGEVIGTFCYIFGEEDITYKTIYEGAWSKDEKYGVLHRIASVKHGAGTFAINWALERAGYLRIDTHPDNKVMLGLLCKLGFVKCGIIKVIEDDYPRIAFDKSKID